MRKAGALYYLFTDHLGSTSVTFNTTNSQTQILRFYPWGTVRSGDVPTDRRFTGQRWDATIGLYDYNARWYDAGLGRFVQPDTIVPNPGTPQDLNRYSYTRNNPIRYTDPTGRYIFEEEPADYFFIPVGRNPFGAEAMRLANDPCLGACTGAPLSDPQTTAIVQTAVGVAWEPADWAMTLNAWRQGDFSWWDLVGLAPIIPAAGVRHADDLLQLVTNPLPRSGRFARVLPEWVAELIEAGRRDIPLGKPGDPDVFVTAAEDLARYRTQSSVERRLGLPPSLERRAVVTFDYDGPIASPVFRDTPGFVGRGQTSGGAREWVIPNRPLDVQPIQNVRVRWLE